jgi:hypothetical protein
MGPGTWLNTAMQPTLVGAGIHTVEDAGERHENVAVERIYRDRMRTCGRRQTDGLQNVAVCVE